MNVPRRVAIAAAAALAIVVATPVGGPAQASEVRAGQASPHRAKDAADKVLRQELKAANARYRNAVTDITFGFVDDQKVKAAEATLTAAVDSATTAWFNSPKDGPATETAKNAILHGRIPYSNATLTEASAREAAIDSAKATWLTESLAAYAAHDIATFSPVEAAARIAYRASSNHAWSDFAKVEQFCLVFDDISNFINWQEACPLLADATEIRTQALATDWTFYVGSGGTSTRAIPGNYLMLPMEAARHAAVAPASASVASHAATRAPRDAAKKALRAALKAADSIYSGSYIGLFDAFWMATSAPDAIFDTAIESATDSWQSSDRGGAALETMKVAVLIAELAYSDATLTEASAREAAIDAAKAMWLQDSLVAYCCNDYPAYVPATAAARAYRASVNEARIEYQKAVEFCAAQNGLEIYIETCQHFLTVALANRDQALDVAKQAYYNATGASPRKIRGTSLWYPKVVTGY